MTTNMDSDPAYSDDFSEFKDELDSNNGSEIDHEFSDADDNVESSELKNEIGSENDQQSSDFDENADFSESKNELDELNDSDLVDHQSNDFGGDEDEEDIEDMDEPSSPEGSNNEVDEIENMSENSQDLMDDPEELQEEEDKDDDEDIEEEEEMDDIEEEDIDEIEDIHENEDLDKENDIDEIEEIHENEDLDKENDIEEDIDEIEDIHENEDFEKENEIDEEEEIEDEEGEIDDEIEREIEDDEREIEDDEREIEDDEKEIEDDEKEFEEEKEIDQEEKEIDDVEEIDEDSKDDLDECELSGSESGEIVDNKRNSLTNLQELRSSESAPNSSCPSESGEELENESLGEAPSPDPEVLNDSIENEKQTEMAEKKKPTEDSNSKNCEQEEMETITSDDDAKPSISKNHEQEEMETITLDDDSKHSTSKNQEQGEDMETITLDDDDDVKLEASSPLDLKSSHKEGSNSISDLTDKAAEESIEESRDTEINFTKDGESKPKDVSEAAVESNKDKIAMPSKVDTEQSIDSSPQTPNKSITEDSNDSKTNAADKESFEVTEPKTNSENIQSEAVDLSTASTSSNVSKKVKTSPTSSPSLKWIELDMKDVGFPKEFEDEVKVGRYRLVTGDFVLTSSNALLECPSLQAPYLVKELDTFPEREEPLEAKIDFFQSSIGKFLIGIGLSRVNEWHFRDLVNHRVKQMKKEGKLPHLEEDVKSLQSMYLQAKAANEPFKFPKKTCSICGFVTESNGILESHFLVPHVTPYREFQCSYCMYLHREPRELLKHMKTVHDKTGRIEISNMLYECCNCEFGSNSKVKYGHHWNRCEKNFNPSIVQEISYNFEYPCLSPKPITVAVVRNHQKSSNISPKAKDSFPQTSQVQTRRDVGFNAANNKNLPTISPKNPPFMQPPLQRGINTNLLQLQGMLNNPNFRMPNSDTLGVPSTGLFPSPQMKQNHLQLRLPYPPGFQQLPRLQGPYPVPNNKTPHGVANKPDTLVVCEICDGYIKDMEQLKTHMQLIHKVKLHPKVLASRPPLNCQKCHWRFFTDQGLERHLLGVHGLVTENMQELANKGRDAGCCTICGRVFASKLVAHISQFHTMPLKPAHLSYKCTMCSATFNLYRLFENHVFLIHNNLSSKRPAENNNQHLVPNKKVAKNSNWKQSVSVYQRNLSGGKVNGET